MVNTCFLSTGSVFEMDLAEQVEAHGQIQEEPIQEGPIQEGPIQQGPIQQGPIQQGPIQQGPIQEGPIQEEPIQEGPIQVEDVVEDVAQIVAHIGQMVMEEPVVAEENEEGGA